MKSTALHLFDEPLGDGERAALVTSAVEQLLVRAGLVLRPPPAVPTSCCGRGCNGCVWEGYFAAVAYWREQARVLLENAAQRQP